MSKIKQDITALQTNIDSLQTQIATLEGEIAKQKQLYDANLTQYGSILNYKKELFGEDDEGGIKKEISDILENTENKNDEIDEQITTNTTNLDTFYTNFEAKLEGKLKEIEKIKDEIEATKEDLKQFSDAAVSGSLFACYKEAYGKAASSSKWYSIASLGFLVLSAGILGGMLYLKIEGEQLVLSSSVSFILLTASFICSSKSKVSHKSFEEYLHKATLLQSFVGYRNHFKEEDSDEFLRFVLDAIKVNASDKVDDYLRYKMPWQKGAEMTKDAMDKITDVAKNTAEKSAEIAIKTLKNSQQ